MPNTEDLGSTEMENSRDHDLLIEIKTQLTHLCSMMGDLKKEAFSNEGFKRCVERNSRLETLERFKKSAESNITWLQRSIVGTVIATLLLRLF